MFFFITQGRRLVVERHEIILVAHELRTNDADDGPHEIPTRATQLDRVELNETLAQIARLPAEQREVLMLAVVDELRYEQIASVLSIPVGTVMSRIARAREKLRRTL